MAAGDEPLDEVAANAPPGLVLPPRQVRGLLERTAGYVVRNGISFEDRIRARPGNEAKMSFLVGGDAINPYYRWRIDEITAGRGNAISAGREGEAAAKMEEMDKGPQAPSDFHFSARMPIISAQDLEVVKLTALFVAKNGRSWMTSLSQREAGNYQFDFLRPQHSLYQFFQRLTEQYSELINGDTVDNGRPQKRRMQDLERNVADRFHVLERAKKRAEWVKHQEAQKMAKEESDEKERIAYAQVDWHDFSVVETVLFTDDDDNADLPHPTSKNDLQSASLEQKAMMTIGHARRIEEAMPAAADYDHFNHYNPTPQPPQQAMPMPMPPPQFYTPQPPYQPTPSPASYTPTPFQPPPTNNNDDSFRIQERTAERERAQAAQAAKAAAQLNATAPMRIRSDYVPRAAANRKAPNTSLCPNCHQAIPNDEFDAHMRIEMLDPRWREQSRVASQRSSTTNLSTLDVANNLKRLASQRSDVFDPVTGQAISEEEQARRKRAEMSAYDGVSSMPSMMAASVPAGQGAPLLPPASEAKQSVDVKEQVRVIREKYGGASGT